MAKWLNASILSIGLALSAVFVFGLGSSDAQVFPSSDTTAGYLVFPKIVVDTRGLQGAPKMDTLVQITNTSRVGLAPRVLQCFYVEGTTWTELDFPLELTPGQPTAWVASVGGGGVPSVPSSVVGATVFTGELKCIEVDGLSSVVPISVNDLKGEATIYTVTSGSPGSVDVRSYNAIGLQATNVSTTSVPTSIGRKCLFGTNPGTSCTSDAQCTGNGVCGVTMCLGATAGSAECPSGNYVSCPSTLILNNFFDQALDPVSGKAITTTLTFVPCTEDLAQGTLDAQPITKVQFLIFNEFEQRMSTATQVQCYRETQLSSIDAKPGAEAASVFNVGVQGTLVGQTRIRPVQVAADTTNGHGLLAIAEEFHGPASVAVNLNEVGTNQGKGDFVRFVHLP